MHLVIPTHHYFFWAVCHPSRTFPQKSLSRNPRIGFPLSPPPDHTLLPLTYNPPPPLLARYMLVKSRSWRALLPLVFKTCSLHLLWSEGLSTHSTIHPWLLMAWIMFWLPILYGLLPLGVGLYLIVGFSFFSPLFCSFLQSCYHFLLYRFAIPVVMLFDPSLLSLFGPTAHSSLNDSIWSFRFCITLLVGSFVPFISSWASLARLLFSGFLDPFSNFAFPWAFTNSFGLPWSNYLILYSWG